MDPVYQDQGRTEQTNPNISHEFQWSLTLMERSKVTNESTADAEAEQ